MEPADREADVHFEDRSRVASMYFTALTGRTPAFHLLDEDADLTPGDTDDTLRLPACIRGFEGPRGGWGWYKVALSFRAMRYRPDAGTYAETPDGRDGRTVMREFLAATPRPAAAAALLEVVEGVRLDSLLRRTLPGLAATFDAVHQDALRRLVAGDGPIPGDPPSVLLRLLLIRSLLRVPCTVQVPPAAAAALEHDGTLLDGLLGATSVAQSVAVAAVLLETVAGLPPMAGGARSVPARLLPLDAAVGRTPAPWSAPDREPSGRPRGIEGMEQFSLHAHVVAYRGAMGTAHLAHGDTGRLASPAILAWRDGVAERDHDQHGVTVQTDAEEPDEGPPEPIPHEHGEVHRWDVPHLPPLSIRGGNVFRYPEWDGFAGTYRPSWCRVIEEPIAPRRSGDFGAAVLDVHRPTLQRLLRQWGRLPREGLALQRRLADGDEIDIDAAIRLRTSRRAGAPADDRVYMRKVPAGREVACAVLVDVSMSTADHVEPAEGAPIVDEVAERLYGRPYRTVLDHEREAALLLAEVMDRLDDMTVMYGFSSTGREVVRMQLLKGIEERTRPAAANRLAALRPLDATRMAAAVRHATAVLGRTQARSRFMIVVSDGLPYDEDYGAEHGDRQYDYALQDTIRAFDEAEAGGVRPVLFLTGVEDRLALLELGDRVEHVADPGDLAEALTRRYLGLRTAHATPPARTDAPMEASNAR